MRDEPTRAEPPPPAPPAPPPSPRREGQALVWAAAASLAFLVLAGGLLWWVLGSSETSSKQAAPATTAQAGRASGSPDTAASGRTADAANPGQRVTLPKPTTTAGDTAPNTSASLDSVGPLTPTRVIGSNTLAVTPRLACTGGSISYFAEQLVDGTDLGWGASSSDGVGQYVDVSFDRPVHLSGKPAGRATTVSRPHRSGSTGLSTQSSGPSTTEPQSCNVSSNDPRCNSPPLMPRPPTFG